MLLPLLALYYYFTAEVLVPAVFFALLCGFLGDLILIKQRKTASLLLGILCFLTGHIFYIFSMQRFITAPAPAAVKIAALLTLLGIIAVFRLLRPPRALLLPAAVYALVIAVMSNRALQVLLDRRDVSSLAVFAGALMFMVSDSILGYSVFRGLSRRRNFAVMLTYIIAQTAIIMGSVRWGA
jgi:uncharacterized membrane protein YhhN